MIHYYASMDAQVALIRELQSWLNTPFAAHGRSKHGGVDCVGLPIMVYRATGLLGDFETPGYALDGGHHRADSPLPDVIKSLGCFPVIWESGIIPNLAPGDLLTLQLGRIPYHCGIAIGETAFIHAHPSAGVIQSDLRDSTYSRRLRAIYRPTL